MSTSRTVADYPDAVQRIVDAEVSPDSTTREAVLRDLQSAGVQVNAEDSDGRTVAENIADAVLTEDVVLETIESAGRLPSEAEVETMTAVSDDYGMSDRADAVADAVREQVATVEEVEAAVASRQSEGPVFRSDVEEAVSSVASRQEFVGVSADEVASEQARSIGAPTRDAFRKSQVQAVASTGEVTPAELGVTDSVQEMGVVTDPSGDTLGVVGGASEEDREAVAEKMGAEKTFANPAELQESMSLEQGDGEARLTIDGEPIREVEI